MNLLRQPFLHFVALGALLFAVKEIAFAPERATAGVGPIVISAKRVEELRNGWLARTGTLPGEREIDALIRSEVDDRLLIAEARRRGLHRRDPVIQRRLIQNMEFLGEQGEGSAEAALEAAYALRLDRSDLVVRRRLIQVMQLEARARARAAEPTESELEEYFAAHPERFIQPERMRISHVYFSRDARGPAAADDARRLLGELEAAGATVADASGRGDPFMFPRDLPSRSKNELAKTFGAQFADRAFTLPTGRWAGPVPSAYGQHLVFVHDRTPAKLPMLGSVRRVVRESLLGERSVREERALLEQLRAQHAVVIEGYDVSEGVGG